MEKLKRICETCRFNPLNYEDYNGKEKCFRHTNPQPEWGKTVSCLTWSSHKYMQEFLKNGGKA